MPKKTMKNTNKRMRWLTSAAIIASLYIALTFLSMALGLDKGAIQVRFSEALVPLAFLTNAAIPGLTVGCFLSNILTGCAIPDIILGPIATLLGAVGAYLFGKLKNRELSRYFCSIPNIIANTVIVTAICIICYTAPSARSISLIPFYGVTIMLGEIISSGLLGTALLLYLDKNAAKMFK